MRKRARLPNLEEFIYVLRNMRLWEKLVFLVLIISFLASFLAIIWKISNLYMVEVPAYGGTLTEGIIGTPRFINPGIGFFRRRQRLGRPHLFRPVKTGQQRPTN